MQDKPSNGKEHNYRKITTFFRSIIEKKSGDEGKAHSKAQHLQVVIRLTIKIQGACQQYHG